MMKYFTASAALLLLGARSNQVAFATSDGSTNTKGNVNGKPTARKLDDDKQPNIIFLLVDDLGSGDVDFCPESDDPGDLKYCPFKTETEQRKGILKTPRMKKMAEEGQIMSNFYSPRAICTPSRAGYMTGRDPSRFGLIDELFRIMMSTTARGGLPTSEKSIAKYLKEVGYATGYTGKWHMGNANSTSNSAYTPINHGFDFVKFFIEGSNGEACEEGALNPPDDNNIYHMCSYDHIQDCDPETRECSVVEQPIRWENVTSRQLSVFKEFIDLNKDGPFFYQHSFPHVHVPWVPSRHSVTDPALKHWTDVVNEVDWAVGYIFEYLKKVGLDKNTMVVFSSDNGPFLEGASSYCPQNCKFQAPEFERENKKFKLKASSLNGCTPCNPDTVSLATSTLTGGKTNTWEGGQRVPTIFWWPGHIEAGTINPIVASGLDLLPTFVSIAGGELDKDITYDGKDISSAVQATGIVKDADPTGTFVYWCGLTVTAVRIGKYKVIFYTQDFTIGNGSNGLDLGGGIAIPKEFQKPTPKFLCGGRGQCCAGSRSCACNYGTSYDTPLVIDLTENSNENLDDALENMSDVIAEAEDIRLDRYESALEDRGINPVDVPDVDPSNVEDLEKLLKALPSFAATDLCYDWTAPEKIEPLIEFYDLPGPPYGLEFGPFYCNKTWIDPLIPDGCAWYPEECQKSLLPGNTESFFEFQNCSIGNGGPNYQGSECAVRLPCCTQEGYTGPFEYIRPLSDAADGWEGQTEQCGCFKNGENSYFPDDEEMQLSVCKWQDEFMADNDDKKINIYSYPFPTNQGFCRLPACLDGDVEKEMKRLNLNGKEAEKKVKKALAQFNEKRCMNIEKFGINNVPTGWMFNAPYPDTQWDNVTSEFLYPNQDYAPGECQNGNGKKCKNGNQGTKGNGKNSENENQGTKGNGKNSGVSNSLESVEATLVSQVSDNPNSSMALSAVSVWCIVAVMVQWTITG